MDSRVAKAVMLISARGSEPGRWLNAGVGREGRGGGRLIKPDHAVPVRAAVRGFTLLELLLVVALIAVVSSVAALALRDPNEARLEREAVRLSALLESARAESRALGVAVTWLPRPTQTRSGQLDFNFVGLPERLAPPRHWLEPGVEVEVANATAAMPGIVLGPEPLIGPQRITLRADDRRVTLVSDGLGPFVIDTGDAP